MKKKQYPYSLVISDRLERALSMLERVTIFDRHSDKTDAPHTPVAYQKTNP